MSRKIPPGIAADRVIFRKKARRRAEMQAAGLDRRIWRFPRSRERRPRN
jgi:hypothetical protein